MARRLDVFLSGILTGQLEQDDSGSMHFRYDQSWIHSHSPVPLTNSMPPRKERYGRKFCRPYFAGLCRNKPAGN